MIARFRLEKQRPRSHRSLWFNNGEAAHEIEPSLHAGQRKEKYGTKSEAITKNGDPQTEAAERDVKRSKPFVSSFVDGLARTPTGDGPLRNPHHPPPTTRRYGTITTQMRRLCRNVYRLRRLALNDTVTARR